jgi:hypothetical protein
LDHTPSIILEENNMSFFILNIGLTCGTLI